MVHSANNNSLIDREQLPVAKRYCVAFSGGVDSTALLIAASQLETIKSKLFAIHINHQIQDEANAWASHCADVCQSLGIPLKTEIVQLENHSENACRQARLKVFSKLLKNTDCLLTAHHADDQVETILFRLFRGAGINGLSGMSPTHDSFGYQLHRPFLALKKTDLVLFLKGHCIKHITDNSNSDTSYSRNFIRHEIIPKINQYDEQALKNIITSSHAISQSNQLLNHIIGNENPLKIDKSFNSSQLLSSAIYHWLINITESVSVTSKQIMQFAHDCLHAAKDKNPELKGSHFKLFNWKNQIFALKHKNAFDDRPMELQLKSNQTLKIACGKLLLKSENDHTLKITVAFQQGHESIKLPNHKMTKKVKKLFQENEIPPWIRKQIPYIYVDDQLISVGSLFISNQFKNYLNSNNAHFEWLSPQFLL